MTILSPIFTPVNHLSLSYPQVRLRNYIYALKFLSRSNSRAMVVILEDGPWIGRIQARV